VDGNLPARHVARIFRSSPQDPGIPPYISSVIKQRNAISCLMFTLCLLTATGCGGGGASPGPPTTNQTDPPPQLQVGTTVTTYHNNNARTGLNATETKLTPSNVNVVSFGKLAAVPVEGDIYAQPLYVGNVLMSDGKAHNLVVVATEHDQVYAIDANSRTVLWHKNFLDDQGLVTPVPAADLACDDLAPEIGITGTPVIDTNSQAIYLVVRTKETDNGQASYFQRLHSLSLITGQDRIEPQVITTPVDEQGTFGSAQFNPKTNNQRSALLLADGQIYVVWASHCDGFNGAYFGWLISFDQATLRETGGWAPTPTASQGGIWMSGGGPSSDGNGDVYVSVGNGWTDIMNGGTNYGDAVVRLHPAGREISVSDYFVPYDYERLNNSDADLGVGSPLLLPTQTGASHPHLMVVTGKDGTLYVLDRDNLGKWQADNDNQVVENFSVGSFSFCSPAFWNNVVYCTFANSSVEALAYDPSSQTINPTPSSTSGAIVLGFPGASPTVSANGLSNAVLWVIQTDQYGTGGNAILRAFDATNLASELYDSELSPDRDHGGAAVKFAVPTVADGEVFVGAHNELDIFGLLGR
jgi:hypothetical protein